MSYKNECDFAGNCPAQNSKKVPWYCQFIKPLFSFAISVLLALSISHLCEKYSTNNAIQTIKSDFTTVRNNLNLISDEVKTLMESRDELTGKLKEISCVIPKLSEAIFYLRNEVSEGIDTHTKKLLEAVSPDSLKKMVKGELQTYDADKTGRTDYALESSGGAILSTRNTETYPGGAPVLKLFGIPICAQQNTPRTIIQTSVLPGECWAFKGSQGSVVIQLMGKVLISGFSLEHISPMVSPTGETSTAPKHFSVYGLTEVDDKNGYLLGDYTYDNSGPPVQYFKVHKEVSRAYEIVELKIHSNSGNSNYTCVYRLRVHGTLTSDLNMKT